MTRYLDPKVDLAFKRIFGEHAHLLKSFLNAVLPLPEGGLIDSLTYLNPEQVPEIPGFLRNSIVDVKCIDMRGRIFIVEMQMLWAPSFMGRIVFGAAQAYVKQLTAGKSYQQLQPVYALALINDSYDHSTLEYYHHYEIVNLQNTNERLDGLHFVLIELPKFKASSNVERKMQVLWLRFLQEIGKEGVEPDAAMQEQADIAQALSLMQAAGLNAAELDAYHTSVDRARIEMSVTQDLLDKGKAEGKAEGKLEIVRALKAQGIAPAVIAAATGLDADTVAAL